MEILEIIRVGYIRSVYFQVQPINKLVEFMYVIVSSYFVIWNHNMDILIYRSFPISTAAGFRPSTGVWPC